MKVGAVVKFALVLAVCCAAFAFVSSRDANPAHAAPLPQAAISIPAGTSVEIRVMELVDSNAASAGQQFRATLASLIELPGGTRIPRGSPASIVLTKSGNDCSVQVASITVLGQPLSVTSGAGTLSDATQRQASALNSVLGSIGRRGGNTGNVVAPIASGARVYLSPGSSLNFVLNGGGQPAPAPSAVNAPPSAANAPPHPGNSAQPAASAPAASAPAAVGGALTAPVKETLLGPAVQSGMYVVSPDAEHVAMFAMHGSRELIIIDGADGPEADHAAHQYTGGAIDVGFSATGGHSGYIAQMGDELVAVINGKRAFDITNVKPPLQGSVPAINIRGLHGDPNQPGVPHQVIFSPSGAHYALVSQESNVIHNVWLDGKKSSDLADVDVNQMNFVGEKLVYAAQTPNTKWHVFVDDKPGPAYDKVSNLTLSNNDLHYAFIAQLAGKQLVSADGVAFTPRTTYAGAGLNNLVIASNGRVGYTGSIAKGSTGQYATTLFVNDEIVSQEITDFATLNWKGDNVTAYVVFSPDGKKYAYVKPVPGGLAAVIDGQVSRAYDKIGLIQFGPDSRRYYYVGIRGQNFVNVDGQELQGLNGMLHFTFSPDANHYGFEGRDQKLGNVMVIDGKMSQGFYTIEKPLAFSADSKHWAYSACTQYLKCQVMIDGNPNPVSGLYTFQTRTPPRLEFPAPFYSPDSSRLGYAFSKADGTSQNMLVVNGQEVTHGAYFTYRSFSPDSKHFSVLSWNGHGMTVIVDGKTGPVYDDVIEGNPNTFKFEDAHTLRLLGIKNKNVYRVVINVD
ncbi:MAG TPA: hypothetical protein VFO34_12410 [Candidatus Acidoferrales bacterium]|nr:hypothetical protein [Candidatus Acidoferrales bacterium]